MPLVRSSRTSAATYMHLKKKGHKLHNMKNLLEPIKAYLKKVFSDLHSAIVGVIVAAMILGGGGIYLFAQNLWTQLKTTAQTPTPLWATIALVLLSVVYIYSKPQISLNDQSRKNPPTVHVLFEVGDFKWSAEYSGNVLLEVCGIPYCKEHEYQLVLDDGFGYYTCPASGCESKIFHSHVNKELVKAESILEKTVRDKTA